MWCYIRRESHNRVDQDNQYTALQCIVIAKKSSLFITSSMSRPQSIARVKSSPNELRAHFQSISFVRGDRLLVIRIETDYNIDTHNYTFPSNYLGLSSFILNLIVAEAVELRARYMPLPPGEFITA